MKKIFLFSAIVSLLVGCGHTNELAKYDLNSKSFYFEDGVAPGAQKVNVDFSSPIKSSDKGIGAVLSVIEDVGSSIVSSETQAKLEKAIDSEEMASHVSQGIEETINKYYSVKSVEALSESPQFIVETTLTNCQLGSSETGVSISVEAISRIIDRKSATVVWEYSGNNVVPVRDVGSSTDQATNTTQSVISAVQLADLSEEEIQTIVYNAAAGAGGMIAEVLREDIADSRSK